jgi:hypothetical protein
MDGDRWIGQIYAVILWPILSFYSAISIHHLDHHMLSQNQKKIGEISG